MSYPTLEQYNEAFQHPQTALFDPTLRSGKISTTGLGLPLALCGGFALTYTVNVNGSKYAVRCFHKQSNALESRYRAISKRLSSLRSPYFLDFEFQTQGVRVNGNSYPVVKMAWAAGSTLGEFIESRYRNRVDLQALNNALSALASYLESSGLAHGDIQPGNVMVSNGGRGLQLIDYDGMFVEELRNLGSAELGHRNFQHPKRSATNWNPKLDRFSFIAINLAIRALESHPELWNKTQSDGDSILFKANDFADPAHSPIFNDLFNRPNLGQDAKNLASICGASFDQIPSLADFIARKNIPQIPITIGPTPVRERIGYISSFPVLPAIDYDACLMHIGDRIELIGKVIEVKEDKTRHGKPYIFINFGPWQGKIVKLNIWSEGLSVIAARPNQSWIGQWVTVVGLMEPPYISRKYHYSHLTITITQANQLRRIDEGEAKFRLAGNKSNRTTISNRDVLKVLRPQGAQSNTVNTPSPTVISSNQAILKGIKKQTAVPSSSSPGMKRAAPPGPKQKNDFCFIATEIYGYDAPQTELLRQWRDRVLRRTTQGRLLIYIYYALSPRIVPILRKSERLARGTRYMLDGFVRILSQP